MDVRETEGIERCAPSWPTLNFPGSLDRWTSRCGCATPALVLSYPSSKILRTDPVQILDSPHFPERPPSPLPRFLPRFLPASLS